jgi:DNA-binding NtrC family response regulator
VRVLVAARTEVVRRGLVDQLRSLGLEVQSGEPADLEAGPDLAGTDVLVYGAARLAEDELTLLEHVRERSPLVEVVVVSSDQGVDHTVQALRSGVYALLPAPATTEQLATTIVGAYARKRHGEQRMRALGPERKFDR